VEVLASARNSQAKITKLEILYSDRDLVAINKPAGLLSVADGKSDKANVLSILRNQLSSSKKQVKLWPVHRLNRDILGVLLFATSMEMREAIMYYGLKMIKFILQS
jgi:23S rRNA pseudouridine1911/1915/1917 synthase